MLPPGTLLRANLAGLNPERNEPLYRVDVLLSEPYPAASFTISLRVAYGLFERLPEVGIDNAVLFAIVGSTIILNVADAQHPYPVDVEYAVLRETFTQIQELPFRDVKGKTSTYKFALLWWSWRMLHDNLIERKEAARIASEQLHNNPTFYSWEAWRMQTDRWVEAHKLAKIERYKRRRRTD